MSIASEIARLQSAKSAIASAINEKGVAVPAATKLDGYPALIGQISSGVTPSGTKTITANGTYNVASFASASVSVSPRLQNKLVRPSTADAIVLPDEGYDGLGAVNLFKVTSAIDANIVASNIKKNVTILGVTGTLEGGGGGGEEDIVDGLIVRNISSITNSRVTSIGSYAFIYCYNLTTASFPACISIGSYGFGSCYKLATTSFPACISIGSYAFNSCYSLTAASFPACKSISAYAFASCIRLTTASFPACISIGSYAFRNCSRLVSLYLTGSSLCSLSNSNAFSSTPIGGYSTTASQYGSIYVPASLLARYKTATNWTYFSSRFVGI